MTITAELLWRKFSCTFLLILLFSSSSLAMSSSSSSSSLVLKGKRVLVTGAGRGIGRAIALICHDQGARVAITSRTLSELKETADLVSAPSVSSCAETIKVLQADVTDPPQVDSMVQDLTKAWGGLDILINNVGTSQKPKGPIETLQAQDLQSLFMTNCVSAHIVTSSVLKHAMPQNGRILNISSKAGKVGLENYSFYVASKFAMEGMTSSWSKELKERQIWVHSMSPGMIDTKSFPKPPNKPGVRTADSVKDCLLLALTAPPEYTGHYIHVDELDMVREKDLSDLHAWKPIDEPSFKSVISSSEGTK
jgi:3-oxoacyl-[acyl-carrier protein] reductase